MHRAAPHVAENDDEVLGESQPLSELLLITSDVSSAAAIDMSRSSSGTKNKTYAIGKHFKNDRWRPSWKHFEHCIQEIKQYQL